MPIEFQQYCDAIEECYEFTLSYAAQGHATDQDSAQGGLVRNHLTRAVEAMRGLEASCAALVASGQYGPVASYEAFLRVLARDVRDAIAVVELVLAQPAISSQLIDNMNASIHLRVLLTDMFLFAEIVEAHEARAAGEKHEVS